MLVICLSKRLKSNFSSINLKEKYRSGAKYKYLAPARNFREIPVLHTNFTDNTLADNSQVLVRQARYISRREGMVWEIFPGQFQDSSSIQT